MADINGLKLINDCFGHNNGDKLLEGFSNAIKKEVREADIIARIGGDEFVFLLPRTGKQEAIKMIKRIKERIKNKYVCNIKISASFGLDVKNENDNDNNISSIFKRAEDQMYRVKFNESVKIKTQYIDSVLRAFHKKYKNKKEHSYNVGKMCKKFATHIIKNNNLSYEKNEEIKRHCEIGYQILKSVRTYTKIANYVLEHHERWDGKGYPRGLDKDNISLQARMLGIVEVYDRMTNDDSGKTLSIESAKEYLVKNANKKFDPELVDIFVNKVI